METYRGKWAGLETCFQHVETCISSGGQHFSRQGWKHMLEIVFPACDGGVLQQAAAVGIGRENVAGSSRQKGTGGMQCAGKQAGRNYMGGQYRQAGSTWVGRQEVQVGTKINADGGY